MSHPVGARVRAGNDMIRAGPAGLSHGPFEMMDLNFQSLSTRSPTGFTPAVPFLSRLSRPPKYQSAASASA